MLQHLITQDANLRMVPTDRDALTSAAAGLREELRAPATDANRRRMLARWTGIASIALGDYQSARAFLRQALDLATASGNTRSVVATQLNLGDAYRYAGEAQTADTLYRTALDTARAQQPDLLDFALQHYAKHLMERGDLDAARAYLGEVLRLRQAKGDTELIESTQAAVDRVEMLLGQADAGTPVPEESSQWSSRWTWWLQAHTSTHNPARWSDDFATIRDAVQTLTQHERVHPQHLRGQFPVELISAMTEEAEKTLAAEGYLHNGKWNAPVGDAGAVVPSASSGYASPRARATWPPPSTCRTAARPREDAPSAAAFRLGHWPSGLLPSLVQPTPPPSTGPVGCCPCSREVGHWTPRTNRLTA
ncbi:tetratricopeptide repeat protein [Streptomyces sp. NPDC004126]|uniref:tetratricopeptide repeat protein n=1 Tax=Streptomyces sp. NPDC004126 TaxID=3390695 RepID=UPI003D071C87